MSDQSKTPFQAGRNIAMKVPPHQFDATVSFYKDLIGLPHLSSNDDSESFAFGTMRLWIDRVPSLSQAEIWLDIQCDDTENAAKLLNVPGVARCDDIEPLPDGLDGFWIANPAGIIHLIEDPKENPD